MPFQPINAQAPEEEDDEQRGLQSYTDGEVDTVVPRTRRALALGVGAVAGLVATTAVVYKGPQLLRGSTAEISQKYSSDMHCFKAISAEAGVAAVYQGKELGQVGYSDPQECIDQCNDMAGCMSFTQCDEWKLCFFKDKVLTQREPMEKVGNGCVSMAITSCPGMEFPSDVAAIEEQQQQELKAKLKKHGHHGQGSDPAAGHLAFGGAVAPAIGDATQDGQLALGAAPGFFGAQQGAENGQLALGAAAPVGSPAGESPAFGAVAPGLGGVAQSETGFFGAQQGGSPADGQFGFGSVAQGGSPAGELPAFGAVAPGLGGVAQSDNTLFAAPQAANGGATGFGAAPQQGAFDNLAQGAGALPSGGADHTNPYLDALTDGYARPGSTVPGGALAVASEAPMASDATAPTAAATTAATPSEVAAAPTTGAETFVASATVVDVPPARPSVDQVAIVDVPVADATPIATTAAATTAAAPSEVATSSTAPAPAPQFGASSESKPQVQTTTQAQAAAPAAPVESAVPVLSFDATAAPSTTAAAIASVASTAAPVAQATVAFPPQLSAPAALTAAGAAPLPAAGAAVVPTAAPAALAAPGAFAAPGGLAAPGALAAPAAFAAPAAIAAPATTAAPTTHQPGARVAIGAPFKVPTPLD